jgi:hypothetical protein
VPQDAVPFGVELSKLLTWMRALAARMSADGADWRSAVDAVRPHTRRLWRSMSEEQKRRFLRHARVYWDAHRPRMAPEVERNMVGLRSSGRLTIIAGRVCRPFNGHTASMCVPPDGGRMPLKIIASPASSIAPASPMIQYARRTHLSARCWRAEPHAPIRCASDWMSPKTTRSSTREDVPRGVSRPSAL